MANVRIFGPWNAGVPGGLQPGQSSTSDWQVSPDLNNSTYQITAHAEQSAGRLGKVQLKVDSSLEWDTEKTSPTSDITFSRATIHATITNVGSTHVDGVHVVISVVAP